jgi:lia operon protein LiaF
MKKISLGKYIMSIVLVTAGIMLLLVNLEVISLEINKILVYSIPVLLILVGLKWLLEGLFSRRNRGSVFWGLFSTIYGSLLLADLIDYLEFSFGDVWKLWPLFLVYIGFKLTGNSNKSKPKIKVKVEKDKMKNEVKENMDLEGLKSVEKDISNVFNIVSDASYKGSNWSVEPMNIHKGILDYDFDFTKAFIPDEETPISISGWVGDIKIRVPEDLEFMIEGRTNLGDIKVGDVKSDGFGQDLYYKTPGYDQVTRKLKFSFNFRVLDLRIERV